MTAEKATHMSDQAVENTDRRLWREIEDDAYSPELFVTKEGGIGINVGGSVIVQPLREWHKLASSPSPDRGSSAMPEDGELVHGLTGMSADIESARTLKLHFDHEVTDADRRALTAAINCQRSVSRRVPVEGRDAAQNLSTDQILAGAAKLAELPELAGLDSEDLGWAVIHVVNAVWPKHSALPASPPVPTPSDEIRKRHDADNGSPHSHSWQHYAGQIHDDRGVLLRLLDARRDGK